MCIFIIYTSYITTVAKTLLKNAVRNIDASLFNNGKKLADSRKSSLLKVNSRYA